MKQKIMKAPWMMGSKPKLNSLDQLVFWRLVGVFSLNMFGLTVLLLIAMYFYTEWVNAEQRTQLHESISITLSTAIDRFDLGDIENMLASIATSNDIKSIEVVDFYGISYKNGFEDDMAMPDEIALISHLDGRNSELRIWWSNSSGARLFYLMITAIVFQFLVSLSVGFYALRHNTRKFVRKPLEKLEEAIQKRAGGNDSNKNPNLGSYDLQKVYTAFLSVWEKLEAENTEKQALFENLENEIGARTFLIENVSNTMALANRSVKLYYGRKSDRCAVMGLDIPPELDRIFDNTYIPIDKLIAKLKLKKWKVRLIKPEGINDGESNKTYIEIQISTVEYWSVVVVATQEGGLAYLFTDISNEKAAEQADRDTRHLQALGVLTGGVAHDINNILAILSVSIETMNAQETRGETGVIALNAIERGKSLVSQLLTASRGNERKLESVNLQTTINNLMPVFESPQYEKVHLSYDVSFVGNVYAEEGLLESTMSNLIINACHAMQMNGAISINVRRANKKDLSTPFNGDYQHYVAIEVSDNGPGVQSDIIQKIFDPFFTTKPTNVGTGLGLSMCKGFAQKSGGDITYHQGVHGGAVFRLILPISDQATQSINVKKLNGKFGGKITGAKRLLLVDDETTLLKTLTILLKNADIEVESASSFDEALILLKQAPFDWILSDMYMKGDTGIDLLHVAKEIQPNAKRLLMSGNMMKSDLTSKDLPVVDHVLSKPFQSVELLLILESYNEMSLCE